MYSSVAVYLDRYSHLTVKYVLGSLPVLYEYNQKTTSWQPVESPQVVLIDAFRLIAISLYKLNCNYLSDWLQSLLQSSSKAKWHCNWSDRRQAFWLLSACDQKWLRVCNTLKLWANIYSPKVFIYAFIFGRCKEIPVLFTSVTEPLASSYLGCIFVKLSVFNVRLTLSEDGGAWDEPSCL